MALMGSSDSVSEPYLSTRVILRSLGSGTITTTGVNMLFWGMRLLPFAQGLTSLYSAGRPGATYVV